jgi:hypothetical protein
MPFARRLDTEKPWAPIVVVAMILTAVTVAFLLLSDTSAPVSATPPAAGASYQAAKQVPSDPSEAEQTADQPPRDPAAPYRNPDDPTADQISASEMPPAPQPGVPHDPGDAPPSTSEQRVLKSRRALETVDPREFLRQATMPK